MNNEPIFYSRKDIQTLCNCGKNRARKIFIEIYKTLGAKAKPVHRQLLPADIVKAYFFIQ